MRRFLLILSGLMIVSCSEDEPNLTPFIDLELAVQEVNQVETDRGNVFYADMKADLSAVHGDKQTGLRKKFEYLIQKMDIVNLECTSLIKRIDQLKLALLKDAGESLSVKDRSINHILWYEMDPQDVQPLFINTKASTSLDNAAVSNVLFTNGDQPSNEGIALWDALISYRKKVVETTAERIGDDYSFSITTDTINQFEDDEDLRERVAQMVDKSSANIKEDRQVLIDLYCRLTKPDTIDNKHWVVHEFKEASLLEALSILSRLQFDILSARSLAFAHIKAFGCSADFGFTEILPMVNGPSIVSEGEEVKIVVFLGAFDEYNQPNVEFEGVEATVNYPENGTAEIIFNAPESGKELNLTGTITLKNTSGVAKTEPWSKTIIVK